MKCLRGIIHHSRELTTCRNFNWTVEEFEKLKAGSKHVAQVERVMLLAAVLFSLLLGM